MYLNKRFLKLSTTNTGRNLNLRRRPFGESERCRVQTTRRKISQHVTTCLKTSSIHGLNHLVDARITFSERIFWFCCICVGLFCTATLSWRNWRHYQDAPTVISMERNYKQWNTSFPAVTFCPDIKADQQSLNNISQSKGYQVGQLLAQLVEATYANLGRLEGDFPDELLSPSDYMRLIVQVAPNFEHHYQISSNGNGTATPQLTKTITEMGVCYTYNSNVAIYTSPGNFWSGNWSVRDSSPILQANPFDGEVVVQMLNMTMGSQVYLHAPNEVPDSSSKAFPLKKGHYLQLSLGALSIYSTEDIKRMRISQRHCRFLDESEDLIVSPVYSYNLCRAQCRLELAMKLCRCVPHFYRTRDTYPICSFKGLKCLGRHKNTLITVRNEKEEKLCACLPSCNDTKFVIEVEQQIPWLSGTAAKWSIVKYPQMRLKRDVIFGMNDLLVSIGGSAGLFLGSSILSFVEIFYFHTLRLFWFLYGRK